MLTRSEALEVGKPLYGSEKRKIESVTKNANLPEGDGDYLVPTIRVQKCIISGSQSQSTLHRLNKYDDASLLRFLLFTSSSFLSSSYLNIIRRFSCKLSSDQLRPAQSAQSRVLVASFHCQFTNNT
jgi:hypothetical protein